ncbi:MAG: lysylphosphatidylglycerol synthase domain-containing protein [Bacteroidales bacterium]|nr:lysylphosphatidylglycerol synthase domain-containing protein [Bacteroidales bacterium]
MTEKLVNRRKNSLSILIKFTIIAISWAFVINKLYNSINILELQNYFSNNSFKNFHLLLLLLILMLLNWSLETKKWQYLISRIEKISFHKAFQAVWTGVTVGTATPNRIGEFGGRIIFLKTDNRKKAVVLTLFGDLSQMIITLVVGIAGLFFLTSFYFPHNHLSFNQNMLLFGVASLLITICLIFYFNINHILSKFSKIKFLSNWLKKYIPDSTINISDKILSLLFSFLRYIVFCFQFYLALKFFSIEIDLIQSFAAISAMYLAIHTIPTYIFVEIGVRLSFAIIFIGIFTDDLIAISFASLLVYLINIVIPIIFGSIFLVKQRNI